ncbi:MAG TPA: DinB family protein [Dehalococcoidia bacterium]|nr:DinB family protein [Dehalococcoidia bacterium]
MVTSTTLKDQLEAKIRAIDELTAGVSDDAASRVPVEGEWCVKEVLSHLAGSETRSFYDGIRLFLEEDTPEYPIVPGDSHFDASREGTSVQELRENVLGQYRQIADLIGGLSEEQLGRKAYMPAFKETPLGDSPTLGLWVGGIVNYHLPSHIEQLQTLCK